MRTRHPSRPAIADDELQRAAAMRLAGMQLRRIAATLGCNEGTLGRKLVRVLPRRFGALQQALAERDACLSADDRDLTAVLLGDPLPGRSALHRRRGT